MGITTIISMSVILWVFLDRVKKAWASISFGNWITTGIATTVGIAFAFGYDLDLLVSLNIMDAISFGGKIFAGLSIAGSSSVINEIISGLKVTRNANDTTE